MVTITPHIEEQIIKDYQSGTGCTLISRKYNIGETSVLRVLKRNEVKMRDPSSARSTYIVNESYFDEINSLDKAYFLGLLYADGNNYTKKFNCVHLSLQKEDGYLVELFSKLLYGKEKRPYVVHHSNSNYSDQVRIRVYNKRLSERLTELGCVANKSLVLTFPDSIHNDLLPHFIRGYFDGDGSLFRDKRNQWVVSIIGSKGFCLKLQDILYVYYKVVSTYREYNNSRNGSVLISRKAEIRRFIKIIYGPPDTDYRMKRKYELASEFLSSYSHGRARWSADEIDLLVTNIELPTRKLRPLLPGRSNDSIERKKAKLKKELRK